MLSVWKSGARNPAAYAPFSRFYTGHHTIVLRRMLIPCLWAWSLGVGIVVLMPQLPDLSVRTGIVVASLAICVCAWSRSAVIRLLLPAGVFGLGLSWGVFTAQALLDDRLPEERHGDDFPLQVEVESLPEVRPAAFRFGRPKGETGPAYDIRFTVRVLAPAPSFLLNRRLSVSWYGAALDTRRQLRSGSRWLMTLRLKTPRGSANPHTFDYEAWLLQRGIAATGYVRSSDATPELIRQGQGFGRFRETLRDGLHGEGITEGEGRKQAPLMAALLLGDKSALDRDVRTLLQETGTAHLLAISGLHVGMVAALGLLLGNFLSRLIALYRPLAPGLVPAVFALLFAAGYTAVAGAPLSAQRALVMTLVLLLALFWRRRIGPANGFALAVAAVVTLQPLAPMSAGFWLSFGAVAGLLIGYSGRVRVTRSEPASRQFLSRSMDWLFGLVRSQFLVFTCLLVPSALIFSGVSLSGLVVNLIAIPWLGFLILPALLLSGVALTLGYISAGEFGADLASLSLDYVDWQLSCLLDFLSFCQRVAPGWQSLAIVDYLLAGLAAGSAVLLILPRGFPGRILAGVLPLGLAGSWWLGGEPVLPFPEIDGNEEAVSVTVLDVGQGLAVTVRTGDYSLVFDTGDSSPSGWSAGGNIIAPYLQGEGIRQLDGVILSHGDRDHAGGLSGLLSSMPVGAGVAPGALSDRFSGRVARTAPCVAGTGMELGALKVRWLWPDSHRHSGEENAHSCVALLEWRGHQILLTGDIPASVEQELVIRNPDLPPLDLLVAPHHGSRTSSSIEFVRWARPARVVFSAGYKHHFGHPHSEVVDRYQAAGAQTFNTATAGAVTFTWSDVTPDPKVQCARQSPRFWLEGELPGCT